MSKPIETKKQLSEHLDTALEHFKNSGSQGLEPTQVFENARRRLSNAKVLQPDNSSLSRDCLTN